MVEVQTDTDRRFEEVRLFLDLVKELEKASRRPSDRFSSALPAIPTLKACTFLLLYNVIESCVRSALSKTYEEMASEGLLYGTSTAKVQELWLKQKLDVPTDSANHQTYIGLVTSIVQSVSDGDSIQLDSRKLPISGNLDGEAVRKLCAKHGVELKVPKWAKGGADMVTVKAQRNALAHGDKSFSECGRDYVVKDLERIAKRTRHFLNGFIKSVTRFNASHGFKAH